MLKHYFSIHRPAGPGTCPTNGLIGVNNYDKIYIPEIGRTAWATLAYDRELTEDELRDYELVPHPDNSEY